MHGQVDHVRAEGANVVVVDFKTDREPGKTDHSLQLQLYALALQEIYPERNMEARVQEALIGVSFMLAATASILLLAKDPHGGETLKDLLVGQILWVDPMDLVYVALVYAVVLFIWFRLRNNMGDWLFYPLFAISITVSTQLVGVYLVFSSLIIPALATYKKEKAYVAAFVIGIAGYATGLLFSALLDLPSGATITWCLAIMALMYFLLFRKRFFQR